VIAVFDPKIKCHIPEIADDKSRHGRPPASQRLSIFSDFALSIVIHHLDISI